MGFADVWNRTLVYFGIAEEDDEWDEGAGGHLDATLHPEPGAALPQVFGIGDPARDRQRRPCGGLERARQG